MTKRDKARGSDEIIMRVNVICAYTASARVAGYVCVCIAKNAGVAGREMLSVYQESEDPFRLLMNFESRTHTDMNVIGGN